jgi:hypothetical protein
MPETMSSGMAMAADRPAARNRVWSSMVDGSLAGAWASPHRDIIDCMMMSIEMCEVRSG